MPAPRSSAWTPESSPTTRRSSGPDQVWCGDITYIRLQREFIYLAVLMDIFTRSIRGWQLGRDLTEELPRAALLCALAGHRPEIHHSDQGVQYAAHGYIGLLEAPGVQISMAAQGQPTQNAYAERLMHTLKDEEVYLHEYLDFADAHRLLRWMGLTAGKYHAWKARRSLPNRHNGAQSRRFWLLEWERKAIIAFTIAHPLEGYRRLTYMMLDADVVAASPSSVYRVLKAEELLGRGAAAPSA